MSDTFTPLGEAAARVVDKLREPEIDHISISDKQHWLRLRLRDITATDVPAVCGAGLFNSPARVWATKKQLLPAAEETAAMRRGRWGEAAVFEAIADELPHWEIRRARVYLRDPQARLGCTPDGVAIDPERPGIGIVQAKVVMRPVFVRDWCDGCDDDDAPVNAPLAYQLQTLTESMLARACWAVLAVLVHDTFDWQLRLVPVDRHAGAEAIIRERVATFWRDYLDPGVCPPIDPARDDELVKQLFPRDDGSEIDLSGDNRIPELIDELATTKAAIKQIDKQQDAIETEIKAKLGAATYGRMHDGRIISYKTQYRDAYSVAPTAFRVLRVSKR